MLTYNAKRMAERAPGVGNKTNMWYMTKEKGLEEVKPELIKKLKALCEKEEKSQREWLQNDLKEIDELDL